MTSLAGIESLLRDAIGLDVQSVGRHVVEAAVRASMEAAGVPSVADYAPMLRDARELQRLIDCVAVPESSFFRDPGSFAYLRTFVAEWNAAVPAAGRAPSPAPRGGEDAAGPAGEDAGAPQPRHVLRVLSIPCASGEEPYSIAMTLVDTGTPFTIDAVDIRSSAIDAARAAVFRPNAFRNEAALAARERWFTPRGNGFALRDSIRDRVRFRRGNLLDPSLLAGETFDVVFCKNLLIYFTDEARGRAVAQLQRWLAPSGRLFAGASEIAWLQSASGFTTVGEPTAMALCGVRRQHRRFPTSESEGAVSTLRTLAEARTLAGNGNLGDAVSVANAWVRAHGPSDEAYVILGLVAFARRDDGEGRAFMERALTLNPENVEALTFLALDRERDGDGVSAALLRERARRAEASHA